MTRVAVFFQRMGPYHVARLRAAAKKLNLFAYEIFHCDGTYDWDAMEHTASCPRTTLFEHEDSKISMATMTRRVRELLNRDRPDVVAIPGWSKACGFAPLLWCAESGTPAIMMSDSNAFDSKRKSCRELVKRRLLRLCSAGMTSGTQGASYLRQLGLEQDRIFQGYDVVDNAHFSQGADAARRQQATLRSKLQLPERYFLASGRFVAKKNLLRLVDAYGQYKDKCQEKAWSLVLLGDGPSKTELVRLIQRRQLANHIHLVGFQQYDQLPQYYGLAECFVHASTTEQWGLVVNEALAARLPVVVSNRCGCAEDLVMSGKNGLTFDPYDVGDICDKLCEITLAADRAEMGRTSQEVISQWTLQVFAENLERAVHAALDCRRRAAPRLDRLMLAALMRMQIAKDK